MKRVLSFAAALLLTCGTAQAALHGGANPPAGTPPAGSVPLSSLATQPDQTIVGNNSGGTASPSALTGAQTQNVITPGSTAIACAGTAADQAALATAAASGKTVLILNTGTACKVTASLAFSSNTVWQGINGQPSIQLNSASVSRLLTLSGTTGVQLRDLTLDGSTANTSASEFIKIDNATNFTLANLVIKNAPAGGDAGGIVVSGTSTDGVIRDNIINNSAQSAVVLVGTSVARIRVSGNFLHANGAFGVRSNGAHDNDLSHNWSDTTGLELIGIQYNSYGNRIVGNYVTGSGDNGYSISGHHNVVMGNIAYRNQKACIWSWGGENTITGNTCLDNNLINDATHWPCVGTSANFGGTGQYNVIADNSCDDDQATPTQYGIRLINTTYADWATSTAYTAGNYIKNGLNIYQAAGSGTSGASAPTCTTGTCSDGTVTWTYINTFVTSAIPGYNTVQGNRITRAVTVDVFDNASWATNQLYNINDIELSSTAKIALGNTTVIDSSRNITGAIVTGNTLVSSSGTTTPTLSLSGSYSVAAIGTAGVGLVNPAQTITDTGDNTTVTSAYIHNIQPPTINASNATTFTNLYTLNINGCPVAGTNVGAATTCGALRLGALLNIVAGGLTVVGTVTIGDNSNVAVGTTNGTKFGTSTSQKLGFFNATPVVQPVATTDLGTVLSGLGLRAAGTAYPITTSGAINQTGALTFNGTDVAITDPQWSISGAGAAALTTISGTTGLFSGILTTQSGHVETVRSVTASGAITVATTDQHVCVNKSVGAATTVNLMATPTTGTVLTVDDCKGDANTNNITVTPAAGNIDGGGTFTINTAFGSWSGYYTGTIWKTTASR